MSKPYFMGDQFVWWQGVVEDVNDPLFLGRCRVRILGFHHPDVEMIPTADLPWAMVIQPVISAAISGIGYSPTGLVPGSWVVGFFRDPQFYQEPVIMGSIAGIPIQQGVDIGSGFCDPNKKYPLESHLSESDLSRLARNENIDKTIVARKKKTNVKGITSAFGLTSWNEPKTPYNAIYPKNHVYQSESGHVQEFDDTPTRERIHTYHRSGTFQEIHPDGTTVNKIVSNNYEIILKNDRVLIRGRKYENIDKDCITKIDKNSFTNIGGNLNIQVEGDATFVVNGNSSMQTSGDHFHKIKGTYNIISEGNITMIAPRIDLNPEGVSAEDVEDVSIQLDPLESLDTDKSIQPGSPAANILSIANYLNPSNPFDPGAISKATNILKIASSLNPLNFLDPANISNALKILDSSAASKLSGILNSNGIPDPNQFLSSLRSLDPTSFLNSNNLLNSLGGLGSLDPAALLSKINPLSKLGSLSPSSLLDQGESSSMLGSIDPATLLNQANPVSMLGLPDPKNITNSLGSLNPTSLLGSSNPFGSILGPIENLSKEGASIVSGFNGAL
jgi:Gp5 N-terminal OB domain